MSVLEKLKALDEQRAKLVEGAKSEALKKANDAIDELNSLGFHYHLSEFGEQPRKASSGQKGQSKRQQKDVPCPICEFKTTPMHDGRAHRSQKRKAPFTAAELTEKGLVKVE